MNLTPATIQTALIALKRQYATIASLKPEPRPGTGDHELRSYALTGIHAAIDELKALDTDESNS